ncbi:MAG TPA: hypothetical protein VIH90_07470 [Candidatus Saccharimonadales bacterium]
MNIGIYLDELEERTINLLNKVDNPWQTEILKSTIDLIPLTRKTIADIYISLDGLDKSLQMIEKLFP